MKMSFQQQHKGFSNDFPKRLEKLNRRNANKMPPELVSKLQVAIMNATQGKMCQFQVALGKDKDHVKTVRIIIVPDDSQEFKQIGIEPAAAEEQPKAE